MEEKNRAAPEKQLIEALGAEELKSVGEDIAKIIAKHNLTRSPDLCRLLFTYLGSVVEGWNCV